MRNGIIAILLFLAFTVSCKSNKNNQVMSKMSSEFEATDALKEVIASPAPPSQTGGNATIDKKIIKTAYINIEVENIAVSRKLIDTTIKAFNGYVISENMQNTESQLSSNINIKVPAMQFDKMLARLASIAKKVDYQNIETQDVTEEYIDVETRLSNSRKVEQSYIKLLQRAKTIEDILKIEQKLGEIRTDIESTQGRLKYLNNQVIYSTINLSVYQPLEYKFIAEKLPSFWERLKSSIISGWRGIVAFILFLIKIWPLWLIVALGWYGWKYFITTRKLRKKNEKRNKKIEKKQKKELKEESSEQ